MKDDLENLLKGQQILLELSVENFNVNQESSQPTESTDDAEARRDFRSLQGDFIGRHHNEPRVEFYVPKEQTFPIPLKCTDVTKSIHTDLDVMQENVSMTIGMSIRTEACQIRGKAPRSSLF